MKRITVVIIILITNMLFNNYNMESKMISRNCVIDDTIIRILENQACWEFKSGNIHLFDGISGNNQCHINALIVSKMYNKYIKTSDEIIINNNKRYLALNLLLSSAFQANAEKSFLANRIRDTLTKTGNNSFLKKASCIKSLTGKDNKLCLKNFLETAKDELNIIILNIIKEKLKRTNWTNRVLNLIGWNVKFSKFMSTILFLESYNSKKINIVFKIKFICDHQTRISSFIVNNNNLLELDYKFIKQKSVIVIDAIASKSSSLDNFEQVIELRLNCDDNFCNTSSKKKHGLDNPKCLNCNFHNIDCECFLEWKSSILSKEFNTIMLSIGANFDQNVQPSFLDHIYTNELIILFFEDFLELSIKNNMNSKKISGLFIEHVYPLNINMLDESRLVDTNSKNAYELLKLVK